MNISGFQMIFNDGADTAYYNRRHHVHFQLDRSKTSFNVQVSMSLCFVLNVSVLCEFLSILYKSSAHQTTAYLLASLSHALENTEATGS